MSAPTWWIIVSAVAILIALALMWISTRSAWAQVEDLRDENNRLRASESKAQVALEYEVKIRKDAEDSLMRVEDMLRLTNNQHSLLVQHEQDRLEKNARDRQARAEKKESKQWREPQLLYGELP